MTDHLPECPNDYVDNGFGQFVYECHCDILRACEQRLTEGWCKAVCANSNYEAGLDAAREAVLAYADDTDKHSGMLKCLPEKGDRCDITAALRVAAQKIDALREEQK